MSADVVEREHEGNEEYTEFATDIDGKQPDEQGLPQLCRVLSEEHRVFEPWLVSNREEKGKQLIISTS